MMWPRKILLILLRKLASCFPAGRETEGEVHEETFPTEIHRVILRQIERIELKCQAEEFARNTREAEDAVPESAWGRLIFPLTRSWERICGFWRTLPRWCLIVAISTIPITAVFAVLYWQASSVESLVTNEELYRAENGVPLVRIAYIREWPSSSASAYLNAEIFRNELNAEVLFKPVPLTAIGDAWSMLVHDKADIYLSAWLPSQQVFLEAAASEVQVLGNLTADACMGLAVPAWMEVRSLEDLAAGKIDFGGVVYGIDPGAKLNILTRKALEDYNIKARFEEKSEKYMLDKLREAMREARPIVVAAWSPHAMFGEFSLRFLTDPRGVYGAGETISIVATRKFAQNFNQLRDFLQREKLTNAQFSDLLYYVREQETLADDVKKWVAANRNLISSWRYGNSHFSPDKQ